MKNHAITLILVLSAVILTACTKFPPNNEKSLPNSGPVNTTGQPLEHVLSPTVVAPTEVLPSSPISTAECVEPFSIFAYHLYRESTDLIHPPSSWKMETTAPVSEQKERELVSAEVEAARAVLGQTQIWISERTRIYNRKLRENDSEGEEQIRFLVYYPELKNWSSVSGEVEKTGMYVRNLFIDKDNHIWGQLNNNGYNSSTLNKIPALSIYNEETRRFEIPAGAPYLIRNTHSSSLPPILLDDQGVFWIFANHDGLYSYDPKTQHSEKLTSLPEFNWDQAVISSERNIYFVRFNDLLGNAKDDRVHFPTDMYYEFNPEKRVVSPLTVPEDAWPFSYGLAFDQSERLWLGAVGYREKNHGWRLVHPDPSGYFGHLGVDSWITPTLIYKSSNGILWFKRFMDNGKVDGTAWYDPETGQGCLITSYATSVIEDNSHRIWILIENNLYSYTMSS